MSDQSHYDIIAIGNPLYNKYITDNQQTMNPILSGPSVTICSIAASFNIDKVVLVGKVGNDYRNRFALDVGEYGIPEYLSLDSVDTTSFQMKCGGPETPTLILLSSADKIKIRDIPEEFLNSEIISLTPVFHEIDIDLLSWIADSSDATLVIDPIGMARRKQSNGEITITNNGSALSEIIEQSDIVKMNWELCYKFTGTDDQLLAAEFLVETGAEIGIITLQNDVIVYDGSDFLRVPCETETNPMGADEAFLGGFLSGYLKHQSLVDCATLGSSIASIMLEKGCTSTKFDIREVQRRKESIEDQVEIS